MSDRNKGAKLTFISVFAHSVERQAEGAYMTQMQTVIMQ